MHADQVDAAIAILITQIVAHSHIKDLEQLHDGRRK